MLIAGDIGGAKTLLAISGPGLSTGGGYLADGIPRRVLPKLTDGRFMQAFVKKGRFEEMMSTLPVHVIMTDAALLGAARYGLDRLTERSIGGGANSVRDDHKDVA